MELTGKVRQGAHTPMRGQGAGHQDPEPGWTPSQCWVFSCGGAALSPERVKKRKQPRIAHLEKPHRNQIAVERCRNAGWPQDGPRRGALTDGRRGGGNQAWPGPPGQGRALWEPALGFTGLAAWDVPTASLGSRLGRWAGVQGCHGTGGPGGAAEIKLWPFLLAQGFATLEPSAWQSIQQKLTFHACQRVCSHGRW